MIVGADTAAVPVTLVMRTRPACRSMCGRCGRSAFRRVPRRSVGRVREFARLG
jgi:hypothetical protein